MKWFNKDISEIQQTIVMIHGLNSSPERFDDLASYYKEQGFNVIQLDSPSGKKMGYFNDTYPGSKHAIRELSDSIPENSIVIGHSWGGAHVQGLQRTGLRDDCLFISMGAPGNHVPDENLLIFQGTLDPVNLIDGGVNPLPEKEITGFWHGTHSGSTEKWTALLDPYILGESGSQGGR